MMYTNSVSNIRFVDFMSVVQQMQHDIIADIDRFDLIVDGQININKNDVQRVFYFYILKKICDVVMSAEGGDRHVFIYNENCVCKYETIFNNDALNVELFDKFLTRLVQRVDRILPTQFFICNDDTCFDELMNDTSSGEYRDFMSAVYSQQMKKNNKTFTFEGARKFIKRYGLTYLDNEYFSKVKIKSLMYK